MPDICSIDKPLPVSPRSRAEKKLVDSLLHMQARRRNADTRGVSRTNSVTPDSAVLSNAASLNDREATCSRRTLFKRRTSVKAEVRA